MKTDFGDVPFSKAHPVLHTALQFGGIGAGAAAAVALVRELKDAMDEREKEKKRRKVSISPGTIVLRVPKSKLRSKYAEELRMVSGGHESVSRSECSSDTAVNVTKLQSGKGGVQRDVAGRFVSSSDVRVNPPEKKAQDTGVGTRAAEILAALGALGGGYYLVDALRQKLQQRRLKKQIAAAQNEYIGMMDGSSVKGAELVNGMFSPSNGQEEKEAGIRDTWRSMTDRGKNVSAAGLALMLATALGSGYITKRVIENKFDEPEEEEPELPKVNRILFKAYDDEKKASDEGAEITYGQALATIGAMMDCMSEPGLEKDSADYSFLDKMMSTDEGRQWILDAYARSRGLDRPGFSESSLPGLSAADKLKYARTLIGIKRNSSAHIPAVRRRVMSVIKENPAEWMSMLVRPENGDLAGRLAGDVLGGLTSYLPQGIRKQSSVLDLYSRMEEAAANRRINGDMTNREIVAKLDRVLNRMDGLEEASRPRRAKSRRRRQMSDDIGVGVDVDVGVESDTDSEGYVVENGEGIARALNALKDRGLV